MLWDFRSSILVNLFWLHQQLGMKALMPYLVSMGLYWHYHGGEGNFPLTSRFWSLFTPIDTPGRGRGGICHFYRWVEEVEFWSPYWVTTCVWGVGFMVFGWRKAVLIKKMFCFCFLRLHLSQSFHLREQAFLVVGFLLFFLSLFLPVLCDISGLKLLCCPVQYIWGKKKSQRTHYHFVLQIPVSLNSLSSLHHSESWCLLFIYCAREF